MSPQFSDKPGRRERHLKRKFRNPLYSGAEQKVAQADVNQARQEDEQELLGFSNAFQEVLKTIVESQVILDLKERVDRLYEQACGLGGDRSGEREGLDRLHQAIAQAIRHGAGNDVEALTRLDEEAQARAMHMQLLQYDIVADLLYPETPIRPEDLIPALLSQDADALEAVMTLFDDEQRQFVLVQARQLLEALGDGSELDSARERVQQLEQRVADTHPVPSAH
jgi:hypothetical protein